MHMLLYLEHAVRRLQHHADTDIQRLIFVGQRGVVSVLHKPSLPWAIRLCINMLRNKLLVQILQQEELSRHVHHRALLPFLRQENHTRDTRFLRHKGVVRTEGRRDMHDARTVLCRYIIACNNAECVAIGSRPRYQLLIANTLQLCALPAPEYHGHRLCLAVAYPQLVLFYQLLGIRAQPRLGD